MAELTDEKIMYQVKDGQLPELRQLFNRYNVPVYNFFLKLTMDAGASEDLVQTLFYRIIRYRHTFNAGNGSFKSWMYQMARNLHADHCRQKIRLAEIVSNVQEFPEDVAEKHEGFKEQDFEKLKNALSGLGPVDRELIVLSRYEGLKYAEIARMKNMSLSAVKVQIHRALKELRAFYFKQ
ncbi:MAG TPA: RNA polymerase sigma factor [Parafilimonas sp.]|nr:RNA polymerase sigma factor [Parafilimonas sp.]